MTLFGACKPVEKEPGVRFVVVNPGHFHAGLVLKENYPGVDREVHVFAPDGPELDDFLNRVTQYNERTESPTQWTLTVYRGEDFLEQMVAESSGNVVILSGNNREKTAYILKAIEAGMHVYADKPMAINSEDFTILQQAYERAEKEGLLIYDIMTERFEITSMLQKELMHCQALFGELQEGSVEDPAVIKESVHHFFKYVSGSRLQRPPWFFDSRQQGEGLVDVTTHLVDLVQWACFPDEILNYTKDMEILQANRWPTVLSGQQFQEVTGVDPYPVYLSDLRQNDGSLPVYCNGELIYSLRGITARVQVIWNYRAPDGGGDTHYSLIRGTRANLEIRQGADQDYQPELYILPADSTQQDFHQIAREQIARLAETYPGLELEEHNKGYHLIIPEKYRVGHEAHFGQVTRNFLNYFEKGALPDWEVPNILAKYQLTTEALKNARNH